MKLLKIILAVYLAAFMPDNGQSIDREDINKRNIWKESQRISGLDRMRRRRLKVIEQLLQQDELNTGAKGNTFKISDKDINVVVNETNSPIKTVVDNILGPLLQDNTENTKIITSTTTESNTETIMFSRNDKSDFINIRELQKGPKSTKPDMKSEATTFTLNKKEVLSIFPKENTNSRHSRRKKSNEYRIWLLKPKKSGRDVGGPDDSDDTVERDEEREEEREEGQQKIIRYDDGTYEVSVSNEQEDKDEISGIDEEERAEERERKERERKEREREEREEERNRQKGEKNKPKNKGTTEVHITGPNQNQPLFIIRAFEPKEDGKANFEVNVTPEEEINQHRRFNYPNKQNWQNWNERDYQVHQQNHQPNVGQWPGGNQQYYPQEQYPNQPFNNRQAQNQPFHNQPSHNQPFNNQPAIPNFGNQRYNPQIPVNAPYPNPFNQPPPTTAALYPNQYQRPPPIPAAPYPNPQQIDATRRNSQIKATPNNYQQMLNLNQQWNPNTPAYIQQQVWTQTTTTAVPITANPTVPFQNIPVNHKHPTTNTAQLPNTNQQQWNNPQYQQQILYVPDIPHPVMLSTTTTTSKPITTSGPTPNPRIDHNGVPTPTIQENLLNALNTSKEKNFNINIHIHNDKETTISTTESTVPITRPTVKRKTIRRTSRNRKLSDKTNQDSIKPTIYTPNRQYYKKKRNLRERKRTEDMNKKESKEEQYETTENPTYEDDDADKYLKEDYSQYGSLTQNFKSITDSSDYSDIAIPEDYLDDELPKAGSISEHNDDFMAFSTFEFPEDLHKQNEKKIKESNAERYASKLKQFLPYLIGRSKKLKGTNKEVNAKLQKNIKEIYKLLRSIDNKNKTTVKETKTKDNAEDEKLARIDKFLEQMPILFNSSLETLNKLTEKVSEMSAEKRSSSDSKNITHNNENYEPHDDENNFYFPENSPDEEDINANPYENPQNYNPNFDNTPTNMGPRNSKSNRNVNSFSPFSGHSFRKRRTRNPGYRNPIQNLVRNNINIENDPSLQSNNFPGIMRYSPKINLDPFLQQTRYNRYYPPGLPNRMNMRPGPYNYIPGGQRYAPNFVPKRSLYRSPVSHMGYGTNIEVKPTVATVMLNPHAPPTQNYYNAVQQKQHLPPVHLNNQPMNRTHLRRIQHNYQQRPIHGNNLQPQKINHYQLPTIHLNSPQSQRNHQNYQPPTVNLNNQQYPKYYQRPPLNLNPQQPQNIRRNYQDPRVIHRNYPQQPVNLNNPQTNYRQQPVNLRNPSQNQQNYQQPPVKSNNAQPDMHNQQKYQQVSAILKNPQPDKNNQQKYRPPIESTSTVGPSFFHENSFTREHAYRESHPPDLNDPEKYLNKLQTEPKRNNNQQNANPVDQQIERMKQFLKQYENKEITPEMLQELNANPYVELIPCNKTENNNNYKREVSSTIATIINRTPGVTNYNNQYAVSSTTRDVIHIRGETEHDTEGNSGSIETSG